VTAPALYRTDLELKDGSRRLMANPSFDFVPYRAQVQRLQKSGIEEAQRARTHTIAFPPAYWIIEPGDIGQWSSFRNGYSNKLFRVDSILDKANLDIIANVTEVDPADYSWNHPVDFQGVAIGPNAFPRPPAQGVKDWFAEPWTLYDDTGTGRRAAIRLAWDGTLPGIIGVQWEVRNGPSHPSAPGLVVNRGRTDQYSAAAIITSQSLVSNTLYEVRGQYIPSSPRDMLWSSWLTVTTPNIDQTVDQYIRAQVTFIENYLNDQVNYGMQQIAAVASNMHAGNWIDDKTIREELVASSGETRAAITQIKTVRISDQLAFASYQTSVNAQFNSTNASVTTNASAIATLNGYAAAQYSVTLDVNGYATGFNLFNGGAGISTATFVQDKFQIAAPGVGGGAPVPIFTVANVSAGGAPAPKIAIRGDMYADGTIYADALVTGTITSDSGKIGALSVKSLSIADNAVTVPNAQSFSATLSSTHQDVASFSLSVNTAGLATKQIAVYAIGTLSFTSVFGTGNTVTMNLKMNGSTVQSQAVTGVSNPVMVLSWQITFTASGGTDSIPIALEAYVAASTFTVAGSLSATASKR
jgi:hypothetical protein